MNLLMAPTISKAKGHKLLGNQCAKGRAAKLLRIFEFVKAYFTEQLLSISSGAVFLGPWAGIDHEKFLIVAGVAEDRILVCSVMINSQINQYIMKRPKMLACQVELKGEDYDFLSHDSYANCAQPIKAKLDLFMVDDLKYCGLLNEQDLAQVQHQIISSGSLTADEIAMFF